METGLTELLRIVRQAQVALRAADAFSLVDTLRLLEAAAGAAGELATGLIDDVATFRSVTTIRTDLVSCVLAGEQLASAGVADEVMTAVLRRGAAGAERSLVDLVLSQPAAATAGAVLSR